jgi:hypothetical protein
MPARKDVIGLLAVAFAGMVLGITVVILAVSGIIHHYLVR